MLKRTITYQDFDNNERTEDFFFHLSQAEITQMDMSTPGGLVEKIQRIVDAKDGTEIMKLFQEIILKAYGRKSADGRLFEKSEQISREFTWSPAYDILFMEICSNPDKAAAFINGIVPQAPKDK
jgi:hypothetical protein